ncbi:MAG: regulatory iron-sulfur-containing complex subunit RicT [Phycisphaerales bacterium JB059]
MPIQPLPQFEADLAEHLKEKSDREAYERLNTPSTIVVRFGVMRMIGEFPYSGDAKPGCGSKIVVRTHRGHEIGEMLTSTCPNAGCASSVTRKQMLDYIQNSGGRDYPFYTKGRALRIASPEDMDRQARIEQSKHGLRAIARDVLLRLNIDAKLVDVEPILGGERTSVYITSEQRLETPELTRELSRALDQRVEVRTIGARDEARINADYERCGQYCCCKSFLKVLKPVSMKSAKTQKATLDPLKISGRCGRLMCCLRYEDQTYDELRRNLPHRKSRVGTPDGDGFVVDTQILTQLALVRLDSGEQVAVPVEDLSKPESATPPPPTERARPRPKPDRAAKPRRERPQADRPEGAPTTDEPGTGAKKRRRRRRSGGSGERSAPRGEPRRDRPSSGEGNAR